MGMTRWSLVVVINQSHGLEENQKSLALLLTVLVVNTQKSTQGSEFHKTKIVGTDG